ncbi:MAG TPA: universal stress protein [Chroococcidiopsis sp.]
MANVSGKTLVRTSPVLNVSPMFQSALICTDLSDGLQRLAGFIPELAESGLKKLIFLHTVPLSEELEIPRPDKERLQAACDRLSQMLTNTPAGVEVIVDVQCGKPIDHILQANKTHQPSVVLVGVSSANRLEEKLFGSTSMELCKRLNTPILTLRPQLVSTYTREELALRCRHLFRYVMVPYDGSPASAYLVQQVKALAQQPNSPLEACLLCWVIETGGRRELRSDNAVEQAQAALAVIKAELSGLGIDVSVEVRSGEPVLQLLLAAQERDISAIATSSGSLGKLISWSVPSLTAEILSRSWHPVLYFPSAKAMV